MIVKVKQLHSPNVAVDMFAVAVVCCFFFFARWMRDYSCQVKQFDSQHVAVSYDWNDTEKICIALSIVEDLCTAHDFLQRFAWREQQPA